MNIIKKSILFLTLFGLLGTPALRAMEEEGLDPETLAQIAQMDRQSQVELPQFGTLIKTDTDLPRLFQPYVTHQTDSTTCGYRVAIYAKTLDELFNHGEALNSNNINRKANAYLAHYESLMSDAELHADEIMTFIASQLVGLNNYYLVGKNPHGENPDEFVSLNAEKVLDKSLPRELTRLATDGGCIHFICNQTGPHWALLSLIKYQDKYPFFLYIDSKNGYLSKDNIIFIGIEKLYQECAKKFPALYEELAAAEQQLIAQSQIQGNTSWMPILVAASAAALLIFFGNKK